MFLSIIILAHNKHQLTGKCLQALNDSELAEKYEIILVDNASIPSLSSSLSQKILNISRCIIIRNEENLSFSKANNIAVSRASGKDLLFLNNDVAVKKDTLVKLLSSWTEESVIGGKLLYPNSNLIQHAGISHMLWGLGSNFGTGANHKETSLNLKRNTFAVTGALMLTTKIFFEEIGGFDEAFSWGYEDIDFCLKAKQKKARIIYEPNAEATHCESATLNEKRNLNFDSHRKNYGYFWQKWEHYLLPHEEAYISKLRKKSSKFNVFGTGKAALALYEKIIGHSIEVEYFITDHVEDLDIKDLPRPMMHLDKLSIHDYPLLIGSQFYYDIYPRLARYLPKSKIIFPIVIP